MKNEQKRKKKRSTLTGSRTRATRAPILYHTDSARHLSSDGHFLNIINRRPLETRASRSRAGLINAIFRAPDQLSS